MSEPESNTTVVTAPVEQEELDPNAPWSPEEGSETVGLNDAEQEMLRATLPVVQEILDWFDEQITGYLNPNVVAGVNPDSDPKVVKESVLFAQKLSRDYDKKRKQFVKRFEPYLKPAPPSAE